MSAITSYLPAGIRRTGTLAVVLAALLALPQGAQADETDPGVRLAANCFTCHGDGVKNLGAIPSLIGITEEKMIETLLAFRADAKTSTIMGRISKGYSEEELKLIAAYFEAANRK